jgi:hypothetical protein
MSEKSSSFTNPSLDELTVVEHHGVKGMHWGVRAAGIHSARRNVAAAKKTYNKEQLKFVKGQTTQKSLSKAKMTFLQHPDRSTAVLLTAGEKVAVGLLFTPLTAVIAGSTGKAVSKGIEARQGIRKKPLARNPRTGVRPIAKKLDQSRFGKVANSNAQRYMDKQTRTGKTVVLPTLKNK